MAELIGAAAGFLQRPVEKVGKGIVAIIKRQYNYLCCFNSNIQSLREEAEHLEDARDWLQRQVDADKNNGGEIVRAVETWFKDVEEIQRDMTLIETNIPNVQSGWHAIKSRYSLSKQAKKTAEVMTELRNGSNFDHISLPAPPASTELVPLGPTREFQSRKQIEEDVLRALRDKNVTKIGICGMGGVGKTTMAKKVMNRVRELNLFDEALLVVVTQQVDKFQIQLEIAELLDFKFEQESLQGRAYKLLRRLTGAKRVLIVLDDIWGKLNLEELGIPCKSGSQGCTTLLTCRNRDVLNQMGAEIFAMDILQEAEAWSLFREKAGICVDDPDLEPIAKEVAKECKGLPVALVSVGCALESKQKPIWEDALQLLKTANPRNMPLVLEEVYNPLLLSYRSLEDQHAKSLFLLCCLFPEDSNISLADLTVYGMGLGMFEGVANLEQARNRVFTAVALLKSLFLLLENKIDHHVKMHDVIRDVAIFIASEERLADVHHRSRDMDCKWISVFPELSSEFRDYLTRSNFPVLRLLAVRGTMAVEDFSFLEGMKGLNVLSLHKISFKSLPETTQLLKNLRTPCLVESSVETISAIGELSNLEILNCYSCRNIKELPVELGRLNRLRSLDFSYCRSVERIVPGVISKLVELEELKMFRSFTRWESATVKEEERKNASLKELESLSKLRHLEIEMADVNLVAEQLSLSSTIRKFIVAVGDVRANRGLDKSMRLQLPRQRIELGRWIRKFVTSSEELHAEGDGSKVLDLSEVHKTIKSLNIMKCDTIQKLVNASTSVFPLLRSLDLTYLDNLKEICEGPIQDGSNSFNNLENLALRFLPALTHLPKSPNQHVSFCNLRQIEIFGCHRLRNLFLLRTAADGLPQLESLRILKCERMKEVFLTEKNDRMRSHITFPKLEKLELNYLPELDTFWRGIESIEFPLLCELTIFHCQMLTTMLSPAESNQNRLNHTDDDQSLLHCFCDPQVKFDRLNHLGVGTTGSLWCQQIPTSFFGKLESLQISNCNNIKSLFLSSIAENLVNLKCLVIEDCSQIETVIA